MSYNTILATAPLTTQNYHLKMIGTSIGNSLIWDNGTNVGIGNTNTSYTLDVTGTGRFTGALTGTTATFSSGLIVSNTADVYPEFKTSAADADAFLGFSNTGDANNAWSIGRRNTGEFWISNYTGNFNSGTRTQPLIIATTGAATFSSSAASNIIFNSTNANGGYLSFQRSGTACGYIGSAYHLSIGGSNADLAMANDSGNLTFVTGGSFTERMRITSDGAMYMSRVNSNLTFPDSVGGMYVRQNGSVDSTQEELRIFGRSIGFYNHSGSRFVSITSGGELSINNTSTTGRFNLYESTAKWAQIINHGRAGVQYMIQFQYNGSEVGAITSNNSNITYATSSDYRLKEDLKDFNGLNLVSKLNVYDFAWKSDNTRRMYGVLAHELSDIIPYAVNKEKDLIKEDGKIDPQGVDYSLITPLLVKAIQEQQVQIEELKAEIDELKNK